MSSNVWQVTDWDERSTLKSPPEKHSWKSLCSKYSLRKRRADRTHSDSGIKKSRSYPRRARRSGKQKISHHNLFVTFRAKDKL